MAETLISWSEVVWNPLRGCTRVSPGCGQGNLGGCYAEKTAYRFCGKGQPYEGLVKLTSGGPRWTGDVRLVEEKLEEPLRWKKPRRIFVNSMSDLFHESVSDETISRIFAMMALCPQHVFQVLTKRADRMVAYLREMSTDPEAYCWTWADEWHFETPGKWQNPPRVKPRVWPLPNVHLGVSVENQKCADERIPHLLKTPAAVRWLSCEPLLESVDISRYMWPTHWHWDSRFWSPEEALAAGAFAEKKRQGLVSAHATFVDWVVIGCESGPNKRPFDNAWARRIIADCKSAGVPVHVKQIIVNGRVSHEPAVWPEGLAIRQEATNAAP